MPKDEVGSKVKKLIFTVIYWVIREALVINLVTMVIDLVTMVVGTIKIEQNTVETEWMVTSLFKSEHFINVSLLLSIIFTPLLPPFTFYCRMTWRDIWRKLRM